MAKKITDAINGTIFYECIHHGFLSEENVYFKKKRNKYDCKLCCKEYDKKRTPISDEKKKLYYNNRDKHRMRQTRKEWEINNKEKNMERKRKYASLNRKRLTKNHERWAENNWDKILDRNRKSYARDVRELNDRYVKKLLKNDGFKEEDISKELIVLKADIIKLKRKIKEKVCQK